jgi:hypothetical protein
VIVFTIELCVGVSFQACVVLPKDQACIVTLSKRLGLARAGTGVNHDGLPRSCLTEQLFSNTASHVQACNRCEAPLWLQPAHTLVQC